MINIYFNGNFIICSAANLFFRIISICLFNSFCNLFCFFSTLLEFTAIKGLNSKSLDGLYKALNFLNISFFFNFVICRLAKNILKLFAIVDDAFSSLFITI